jgi:hypothetical protein
MIWHFFFDVPSFQETYELKTNAFALAVEAALIPDTHNAMRTAAFY